MTSALLTLGRAATRLGIAPRFSETPDHRLVEVVQGRTDPGRALDLGTGAGRNALYLAANGWDSDVSRLSELDIGAGTRCWWTAAATI